jgi:aspartate/methionine/tyrosine aminotransferase
MKLPHFLLGNWLSAYDCANPPIRYNLAGSTGPRWKFGDLLALGGAALRDDVDKLAVSYAPSDGAQKLRQQIARVHGVDPAWVVVTTGASEAISALMCVTSAPGASVVLPAPGYPATDVMAASFGLYIRTYALTAEHGFTQNAATVLAAVDSSTRLVLVNSPHNPTGSVLPAAELRKLASALAERSIPLVVDEVFHRLYFGAEQPTAATNSNTIVLGDMSKSFSLPGLRTGWLIDADAERRRQIVEARSYFSVSGSPLLETLSVTALESSDVILSRLRSTARANLAALENFIAVFSPKLHWVKPVGGTLAFPWLADGADARPLCEAWAKQGVLVAPGDCFGMPQHMRIGFAAAEPADFEAALARMGEVLGAWPDASG